MGSASACQLFVTFVEDGRWIHAYDLLGAFNSKPSTFSGSLVFYISVNEITSAHITFNLTFRLCCCAIFKRRTCIILAEQLIQQLWDKLASFYPKLKFDMRN